jgi:hypothetical protein
MKILTAICAVIAAAIVSFGCGHPHYVRSYGYAPQAPAIIVRTHSSYGYGYRHHYGAPSVIIIHSHRGHYGY